jgi:hypothetical protein
MELLNPQMALTLVVVLTGAVALAWFDYLRKHRQPQRIKLVKTTPPQRSSKIFDASPLDCAPAKRLAAERPLQPLVAVATSSRPRVTSSRPRVESRIERETVTVQMTSPSPATSSSPAESPLQAVNLPAFTIDAVLWERLISSLPKQNLLSSSAGESKPIATTPAPVNPSGRLMQLAEFEDLLKSEAPFTGLVVSISINDSDSSMWHGRGLMQSVSNYIAGLLRENELACRTSYDEFVIVCRGEEGAQSQRRLNHISERLWDYQLRGIGSCSILFSWGGVQVQDRPLAEAIASATERMRETKRGGHSAKSSQVQRQAV